MPSFGIVADACVLVPAALRDTMLRVAAKGLYRLYWSQHILEEVSRVLVQQGMTSEEGAHRLLARMRETFSDVLDALESVAPEFVAQIRTEFFDRRYSWP